MEKNKRLSRDCTKKQLLGPTFSNVPRDMQPSEGIFSQNLELGLHKERIMEMPWNKNWIYTLEV